MTDPVTEGQASKRTPTADAQESELTTLVGRRALQKLQDRFAALGQVTVCVCTVDGTPITKPTWGSRYSKLIGTSKAGRKAFTISIRAAAEDTTAPVPSMCHKGMSLYASPITHADRHVATIVVGSRAEGAVDEATIEATASEFDIDLIELRESAALLDRRHGGTPESIHRFADTLADTIATLYGQADQIRHQLADLQTVHELADLLSGSRDLQEILNRTVQRVVEIMPVKACAIRLLNRDTGELVIKAVHNLSEAYLNKGPVLVRENAIDAKAFDGEAVYIEDATNDPRIRYPENARREGLVSGLCVPMTYRGQTIGVIRVYTSVRYRFTQSEEALMGSIGSQTAAAIVNTRLIEEQVEADRVQRQMESAAAIQQRMLPVSSPRHARLEWGCVYDPTLQLGGDFYDFVELADGRLGVCVADVVGKGLPAALMMASVRSALRAHAANGDDVDTIVTAVNRHMHRDTLVSEFATLVYGVFSEDGSTLTYCNAGHEPPLLLRDGRFTPLTSGGMVIGVMPGEAYVRETIALRSGDVLVIVTDGVTEALDFADEAYGRERLNDSIRTHASLDAQQLAQQVLWDVRRFVGLADQSDDITVVVAKVS